MSHTSQIYVRYDNKDKKELIANFYTWNYGERMISRARWGIEHIKRSIINGVYVHNRTKLSRIFDTNFDMQDYQISNDIIKKWQEIDPVEYFNDYVFWMQENCNGKLFVDICDGVIKYAFINGSVDTGNIMDAESYMSWDCQGDDWEEELSKEKVMTCKCNIEAISKMAQLMTREEIEQFLRYDYVSDIGNGKPEDYNNVFIYVPSVRQVVMIAEGTGDNLLSEDKAEGYVDYIMYYQYALDEDLQEVDGGQVMTKMPVQIQYKCLADCIPGVLDMAYGEQVDFIILR